MDKPLYPKGVHPEGHTHAFDVYTHPFQSNQTGLWGEAQTRISEYQQKNGPYGVKFLGILAVIGIVFRLIELRWDLQKWFLTPVESSSKLDVALPSWLIGTVAGVGLIGISVFGAYLYYPEPDSLLHDLSPINTNCVLAAKTGDWEAVKKLVVYCDDLSRRLEVGVLLRTGTVSEFKRAKASAYREKLDELRDDVAAGQTSNINEQATDLSRTYLLMSAAFREVDPGLNLPN